MAKTIIHDILFKGASPKQLYELYMDSKKHSEATGAPAELSNSEGGKYSVHNGWIGGSNLKLIKDQLIVQSWRAQGWSETDPDSTFIIYLEPKGDSTVVHAVHANVPDNEYDSIEKGWHKHYWEPWKLWLAGKPIEESIKM